MPIVDKIDLNGNSVAEETGQSEITEVKEETTEETKEETKTEETQVETKTEETEDVEALKERLKKVEEEKENYKKGMLKYKDLTLKKPEEKSEEKEEEEYPEWDENSKKFQKQTLSEAEKRAEAKAQATIEKANEKAAIAQFVAKHPDLAEESVWSEVIANYHPKNGKDTPQDIIRDLDRALVITRYEKGEFTNLEAKAEERGVKKGKAETKAADLASVSKTTSKTVKEGNTLSPGAIRLAEAMRVDPKKLAEEDDSSMAEIKL